MIGTKIRKIKKIINNKIDMLKRLFLLNDEKKIIKKIPIPI
tara:strand:+ start:393 stop:515 length:123 start_codon:yes stop_codon:yes gene_type:complete